MARRLFFVLLTATLLVLPRPGYGETRYVSDQLYIALRDAPDLKAQVLTTLKTDTPLTVLEEQGEFVKVRTPDNAEGYVLGRYLTTALPKSRQIEQLQQEREALQKKIETLQQASSQATAAGSRSQEAVAQAHKETAATQAELDKARTQLDAVNTKYEALKKSSSNVVALAGERDRLKSQNQQLTTEVETLRNENNSLLRTGMIRWFLAGAGVFLVGWLVGKLSRKKRRTF